MMLGGAYLPRSGGGRGEARQRWSISPAALNLLEQVFKGSAANINPRFPPRGSQTPHLLLVQQLPTKTMSLKYYYYY